MQIAFAILMLLVAGGIWLVFLRPVPTFRERGVVTGKEYQPSGTYWQYHAGDRRGFRTPTPIAIAESYSLSIKLDKSTQVVQSSVNSVEGNNYHIGTPVQLEYCVRGVPLLWSRVYVLSVAPVDAGTSSEQ